MNEAGPINMEQQLISIIVPLYNGEKYIESIYHNVLNQTYRPIELILVNDGSTDQTQSVIEHIQESHDDGTNIEIKIYHKANGGIASARNLGLREASGIYIMFMDQDDRLEPDCAERLMHEALESHADLVIGGVNIVSDRGRVVESWRLNPELPWNRYRITAPWGRVFRKALIDGKKISFYNTKISEDLYFNILFLSHASNVKVISYIGYNWVQNQNSESHSNQTKMSDDRNPLPMLTELHKQIENSEALGKDEMTFFFTKYIIWYLLYCSRRASKFQVKGRSEEIFVWLEKQYPDFYRYMWKSFCFPKGEQIKIRFCVAFVLMMRKLGLLAFFLEVYRRL